MKLEQRLTPQEATDGWLKSLHRSFVNGSNHKIRLRLTEEFLTHLRYCRALEPRREEDEVQHRYNCLNAFTILNKKNLTGEDMDFFINVYEPLTNKILYNGD